VPARPVQPHAADTTGRRRAARQRPRARALLRARGVHLAALDTHRAGHGLRALRSTPAANRTRHAGKPSHFNPTRGASCLLPVDGAARAGARAHRPSVLRRLRPRHVRTPRAPLPARLVRHGRRLCPLLAAAPIHTSCVHTSLFTFTPHACTLTVHIHTSCMHTSLFTGTSLAWSSPSRCRSAACLR
jgi:hypothetical protein